MINYMEDLILQDYPSIFLECPPCYMDGTRYGVLLGALVVILVEAGLNKDGKMSWKSRVLIGLLLLGAWSAISLSSPLIESLLEKIL